MKFTAGLLVPSLAAALLLPCQSILAANLLANLALPAPAACGSSSMYAPPIALDGEAAERRKCAAPEERQYKPKFRTIAHEILEDESQACFVPDSAFELLDRLIEQGRQAYKAAPGETADATSAGIRFFQAMGRVLLDAGYQLHIPTETLGDALVARPLGNGGQHMMDCDTGSLLYMSAAEVLGLPVNMVEINLASGDGHNYIRWSASGSEVMDWDTNGRKQCSTPDDLPSWQGRTMSTGEVLGYARGLRGLLYQKSGRNTQALTDYRSAAAMYPASPWSPNNLAWLLATRAEFDTPADSREAVDSARRAVSVERSANNLDTLACALARQGDFTSAATIGQEVISLQPKKEEFARRLQGFQATPPVDCVGLD